VARTVDRLARQVEELNARVQELESSPKPCDPLEDRRAS
jgi:outer membrane murein-binding lipoprotein Lpp